MTPEQQADANHFAHKLSADVVDTIKKAYSYSKFPTGEPRAKLNLKIGNYVFASALCAFGEQPFVMPAPPPPLSLPLPSAPLPGGLKWEGVVCFLPDGLMIEALGIRLFLAFGLTRVSPSQLTAVDNWLLTHKHHTAAKDRHVRTLTPQQMTALTDTARAA